MRKKNVFTIKKQGTKQANLDYKIDSWPWGVQDPQNPRVIIIIVSTHLSRWLFALSPYLLFDTTKLHHKNCKGEYKFTKTLENNKPPHEYGWFQTVLLKIKEAKTTTREYLK